MSTSSLLFGRKVEGCQWQFDPIFTILHSISSISRLVRIKRISFVVIMIAVAVTVAIGVKITDSPIPAGALVIIGWAITPYIYLAIMTKLVSHNVSSIIIAVLAFIVGGFGVGGFVDAMFIHPDAQGGLAFIVVPLWQWALLLLTTIPVYFLNKTKNE